MKWSKMNKNGTTGVLSRDNPPEKGVGIAQCEVPHFPDPQYSLNYISVDGEVVSVELCCHGQARHHWLEEAKRYAK